MSNHAIKKITSPIPALGPYSPAINWKNLIFTSGQIPITPETNDVIKGGITEQTTQAMKNLREVLTNAGSDLSNVLKTTVFLKDMNDFQQMNTVYATFFGEHQPARSAVQVARLPKDVLIEIECIAIGPE